MKKTIKSILGCAIIALSLGALYSCSEKIDIETGNEVEIETTVKTCPMNFEGGVVGFDQNMTKGLTKAASSSWNDGDKVYIIFYNGTTKVPGEATYSTSGGCNVSYDGDLATGTGLKCEVRYFINATFQSSSLVSLNSATEIYEATNGSYEYNGSTLTVQASMTPKTGRIRFSGKSGEKIYLTGISVYTTYSPALNTFSSTKSMIATTVATSGYTPYIYGSLADSNKQLGLVGSDYAFTRTCTDAVLKVGDSGYMAIPSDKSHNNWKSGLYVTTSGVEFKMVPVAGHSSGFFMIGETEVTRELYYKITGTSSSSNLNHPISNVTYPNFASFITQLNYNTNLTFSLPTKDQWLYAAKGGNLSQGYIYSGSNNPGDVAWYEGNSQGAVHPVKQLAPNELGIYDMSGNVDEYTSTKYSTSYTYSYYRGGGNYKSAASGIKKDYMTYYSTDSSSYTADNLWGFRLILVCQ